MKYHIYKKVTDLGYTVYFIRDENDNFMDIGLESCPPNASPLPLQSGHSIIFQ